MLFLLCCSSLGTWHIQTVFSLLHIEVKLLSITLQRILLCVPTSSAWYIHQTCCTNPTGQCLLALIHLEYFSEVQKRSHLIPFSLLLGTYARTQLVFVRKFTTTMTFGSKAIHFCVLQHVSTTLCYFYFWDSLNKNIQLGRYFDYFLIYK